VDRLLLPAGSKQCGKRDHQNFLHKAIFRPIRTEKASTRSRGDAETRRPSRFNTAEQLSRPANAGRPVGLAPVWRAIANGNSRQRLTSSKRCASHSRADARWNWVARTRERRAGP
jgi:hypothetical protein